MKIIGYTKSGFKDEYVAIVSHEELEKCADLYYGKMKKLEIGAEVNVGAGYDFRGEIQRSCRDMVEAMKQFDRAQRTLHRFAIMVSQLPAEDANSQGTEAA